MSCLSLIQCNSYDFVASAPFQLGIDVNRHTLASYKGKATYFILPFDLLLYVEKDNVMVRKPSVPICLIKMDSYFILISYLPL